MAMPRERKADQAFLERPVSGALVRSATDSFGSIATGHFANLDDGSAAVGGLHRQHICST